MKKLFMLIVSLAAWFSCGAGAQTWILFVPAEHDFRVLLPAPPQRLFTPYGSVEFRIDAGQQQYSIFRHDPRRLSDVANVRDDIIRRISSDDQTARSIGQDSGDLAPNEFIFRVGGVWTMHRAIVEPGRYYELVVKAAADDGIAQQAARDFFNSFQLGRAGGFPAFMNAYTPESCQTRSNEFSRRFCEYLTCLRPGYEAHPVCSSLPPLLRN